MFNNPLIRDAVRVKVKKCDQISVTEWRRFSIDPHITKLDDLNILLAKAFDIQSDFFIKYKTYDPAGNEQYLAVLSDWDLNTAFMNTYNISIQTSSEPCLMLQINMKPVSIIQKYREMENNSSNICFGHISKNLVTPTKANVISKELISPLQQSLGASQKYMQQMQTKLPGMIMNQMEKTFSMVQKAFNLSEETMAALPPRPPLSDNEFRQFLDAVGQIKHTDELRKVIFFGGIDPSLRRVVWKYILDVYPIGMNGHQRMEYMRRKAEHYYQMRGIWKMAIQKGYLDGDLAYVTDMVKKDVLRTDRLHPFYAGHDDNQNITSLFNILTTYALNHPSVSYCQGMSDIASPLLVTMNDEAQAYICFCAVMRRLRNNFTLDGIAMTQKFVHLSEALNYYDPEFWEYIKLQQADDLLFCYRWLLLEMKREFPFEDALRMLEVQWSSLKYDVNTEQELILYEKEFIPNYKESKLKYQYSADHSNDIENNTIVTSISYPLITSRERTYKKICGLTRQDSTSSSSMNSSISQFSLSLENNFDTSSLTNDCKSINSQNINHSFDNNITWPKTYQPTEHSVIKAHHSLDETKLFYLNETINEKSDKIHMSSSDVIYKKSLSYNFHDTNPFKDDIHNSTTFVTDVEIPTKLPKAFLNSSSSSTLSDLDSMEGSSRSFSDTHEVDDMTTSIIPSSIAKLQNKNVLSNYNVISEIIVKQLNYKSGGKVGEGLKRVGSMGGENFKDLKEKITSSNKKGLITNKSGKNIFNKPPQKLIKSFNEFFNFPTHHPERKSNILNTKLLNNVSDSLLLSITSNEAKTIPNDHNSSSVKDNINSSECVLNIQEEHVCCSQEYQQLLVSENNTDNLMNKKNNQSKSQSKELELNHLISFERFDSKAEGLMNDKDHLNKGELMNIEQNKQTDDTWKSISLLKGKSLLTNIENPPLPEVFLPLSTDTEDVEGAIVEIAITADEHDENRKKSSLVKQNLEKTNECEITNNINSCNLPPPAEFGDGNPFLIFLCLTLLLQHRDIIMQSNMDYNEIAMYFDKMVRKHDVTRVLNQARSMYIDYINMQHEQLSQQKVHRIEKT